MNKTVQGLIASVIENLNGEKPKCTSSKSLEVEMLRCVLTDESYEAEFLDGIKDGQMLISKKKISPVFREMIAQVAKKGGASDEEASVIAASFIPSKAQAEALIDAVHEGEFLLVTELNKKIRYQRKPNYIVDIQLADRKATSRKNPKNPDEVTHIAARTVIVAKNKIMDHMKTRG